MKCTKGKRGKMKKDASHKKREGQGLAYLKRKITELEQP